MLPQTLRDRLAALTEDEIEAMQLTDDAASPPDEAMLERAVLARRLKRLRRRLDLSQAEFAARFRIPQGTVKDWEQARRMPDAPALAYLAVIEAEPEAVDRALTASARKSESIFGKHDA
ncbi:helix-turn-helix domain-containing protein [Jiella endophytica]|uniref:Helix-turn-helix domain-containing protein n=1 Tax=Jiella endophytica TaxID=2558362 RepID=A0A4Y8RGE7_9HYPH|nr:helix-turn-helix domain-containing protein [Jiella endophytica]TFF21822.1 helix-turn-helix domain-containing protein [Jiella endophytica]